MNDWNASGLPDWKERVKDEAAVASLASAFAGQLSPPLVIYLQGDLGAGKTTFARALIQGLGYPGYVKSPSYGLLESYQVAGMNVLHLDLYRIEDPEELDFLALRDLYDASTLLLVEWPDRGQMNLPQPDICLEFDEDEQSRFICCHSYSEEGRQLSGDLCRPTR